VPKIKYQDITFSPLKLSIIAATNKIISNYHAQGFNLTLRQTYYQFVSHDLFPDEWKYNNIGNNKWVRDPNGTKNAPPNYNALGDIISDGRMAGLIDWYAIVDRSRGSNANQHWGKPEDVVRSAANSYATDKWSSQDNYVEVWVEKEALEDVLARACRPLDVRYFACKGYTSQSSMWEAAQRLLAQNKNGKQVHIIHLGDHDPSGIDMSRDIFSRLGLFVGSKVHVQRIALNMPQIQRYHPPPNPAKTTDSRFADYQAKYGDESWELDALEPRVLVELITKAVVQFRDEELWKGACEVERKERIALTKISENYDDVVDYLRAKLKKVP
jgi:hypothetical protein